MLFLYQETYYVTPGLQDVIDKRVRSLHENHATNAASVAMDWFKYLGDATTYLAFRLWSEREVTFEAPQVEFMAEYNRSRPVDAFYQPPDIEFFEQVAQSGAPGGAGIMVRTDLETRAGDWEHDVRAALLDSEGFREYRLYRFMGGESRYFRAEFWQDAASARQFWHGQALHDLMLKLPQRPFRRAPRFGFYEVLHQLGDARPR